MLSNCQLIDFDAADRTDSYFEKECFTEAIDRAM